MSQLPVVNPSQSPEGDQARVVGVLLAAGMSSRYSSGNKLLATLDGEAIVSHAARTLTASKLDDVVAVLGHDADAIESVLDDAVSVTRNDDYAAGLSTSVAAGVRAAREREADAALVALGDMPWITPDSVDALVRTYGAGQSDVLAAACDGIRGNPTLFDRRYFGDLCDLDGDTGGREILLASDESVLVETGDPGVLQDVDRPADRAR